MAIAPSTKPLAEKLQMKSGRSVAILNKPKEYEKLLGKLPEGVALQEKASKGVDIIQLFVQSKSKLEAELPKLKAALAPTGMIWVTYPKGTSSLKSEINRDSIAEYAASIGLEGVAIVAVDEDWSALRLKIVN